jgi:hypothetical protein
LRSWQCRVWPPEARACCDERFPQHGAAGSGQETSMLKIYADPITVNCRKVLAGLDLIG